MVLRSRVNHPPLALSFEKKKILLADTGFLAGLGVMDYSLLVGVDKARGELVVGVIDYCRQVGWPHTTCWLVGG